MVKTAETSPASPTPRPLGSRRVRARRVVRLAVALGAAALLAGFVFAPAASAATGDFIITGRGYGQGEGLGQWGAWQGAREGNTYQQILAFYYPGTTLAQLSSVAPTRQTVTVRITTTVDTFANVQLTASVTSATLVDSTGATIQTLAAGDSVTLLYNGGKVQVSGVDATYAYVDLKPDDPTGRVTVNPSDGLWSKGPRQYWGYIRILPDSSTSEVCVHNTLPIDEYVAGVSEISPDWAVPTNTDYYAPDAVKALDVAARTYVAAHTGSVPYDDSRDMTYVGYNVEASYPYLTTAANDTAGQVVTYRGKLATCHFSSSSGGFTTNSAWSDTGAPVYEAARSDPWSLTAPPTLPGYAWSVTVSPSALAADLASHLNVGTITQVDVTSRDVADPNAHARYLKITGSTGTATIAARDFRAHVGLKSTLILSIVKDGSLNRYEQNDTNLVYAGTWTAGSATAASGGSFRYSNTSEASCTVSFNGTYLAWLAKKSPGYGIARLTLDGVDQGTVDLYNASGSGVYTKVWETGTLSDGTHTLKIERTGDMNPLARDTYISVDAFDISGNIVPAPKPPPATTYQETDPDLLYLGAWVNQPASPASGGSFRYLDSAGSCTVKLTGTSVSWIGKKKATYGIARVTLDGVDKGTVDLYSATELYGQLCWQSGTLSSGEHTLSIAWTGSKNSKATDHNVSVDALQILGSIAPACTRVQQSDTHLTYAGTWSTFTASGASGGSYVRANRTGASVTVTFKGAFLAWIATKGTTLGKAYVSLDNGTAKSVNLAASAVAYQQRVWNTGLLSSGVHTVKIWWESGKAAGKYISVDAIDLLGTLQ